MGTRMQGLRNAKRQDAAKAMVAAAATEESMDPGVDTVQRRAKVREKEGGRSGRRVPGEVLFTYWEDMARSTGTTRNRTA